MTKRKLSTVVCASLLAGALVLGLGGCNDNKDDSGGPIAEGAWALFAERSDPPPPPGSYSGRTCQAPPPPDVFGDPALPPDAPIFLGSEINFKGPSIDVLGDYQRTLEARSIPFCWDTRVSFCPNLEERNIIGLWWVPDGSYNRWTAEVDNVQIEMEAWRYTDPNNPQPGVGACERYRCTDPNYEGVAISKQFSLRVVDGAEPEKFLFTIPLGGAATCDPPWTDTFNSGNPDGIGSIDLDFEGATVTKL